MREILFRGKDYNGEWAYGYLIHASEENQDKNDEGHFYHGYYILKDGFTAKYHTMSQIFREETIGQYTGLKDKNGTKIFEKDIVKFKVLDPHISMKVDIENINLLEESIAKIDFQEKYCVGIVSYEDGKFIVSYQNDGIELYNELKNLDTICEVVGNTYDSKEIVKE